MKKKRAVKKRVTKKRTTKRRATKKRTTKKRTTKKRTTKHPGRRRSHGVVADVTIQTSLEATQKMPALEVLGEIEESLALSRLRED